VLFDRTGAPQGYVKSQEVNLNPGETRGIKVRWNYWDRTFVEYAAGRAQIGGEDQ
jgi:hypothetical protein